MASETDLKLLGTAESPFVVRVRMALHMKGLPYEYLQQDLFDKSDLLVSSNPVHKKVPVLIHGGKPVLESLAIVQYIDEAWSSKAPTILPADPYQRATARFWAAYADDKLYDAWAKRFGETEAAKQAVPEVDIVVEYAKKRRASRAAAAAAAN